MEYMTYTIVKNGTGELQFFRPIYVKLLKEGKIIKLYNLELDINQYIIKK